MTLKNAALHVGILMLTVFSVGFLFASDAYADTSSEYLLDQSVGSSIVFNTSAYNDADTSKLGFKLPEKEELELGSLVMVKVTSVLNVRSEGNPEAEIVGKIYRDCGGTIIEKGEEWSKIQSGELIGWCSNEYLLFGDEAVALAKDVGTMSAVTKNQCTTIHAEANADSQIVSYASRNTFFEVIYEVDEDWVCVALDDCDGFVKREFIDLHFDVDHGETMEAIKERQRKEEEEKRKLIRRNEAIQADGDTLKMLATIIWCEARGEGYEGQLAVGSVVMNRVRSGAYPATVYDVIFASGQFSPVKSGAFARAYENDSAANTTSWQAAVETMGGYTNVGDMTHFRRKGNKEGYIIGNHVFY